MAEASMNVLPVVRRDNVRKLQGIVALPDILSAYGLGEPHKKPGATEAEPVPAPGVRIVGVVAATIAM